MEQDVLNQEASGFISKIISYFDPQTMLIRIIALAIIVVVASLLTKIVSKFFKNLQKRNKISSIFATLMRKTANGIIWVIAAISILQDFGVNLTPVIAGLGVSGVVLGLALQETIASFFSGLIIAVKRPFEIGDYVSIDGTEGSVKSMDIMGISLTTADNKLITMSNKNVWGSVIINSSALDKRRVDMIVSVAYGTDLEKALDWYRENSPKGECVLVLEGKSREEIKEEERSKWEDMSVPEHVEFYLKQGMEKKEAMKQVAKDRGVSKREIYGVLLQES